MATTARPIVIMHGYSDTADGLDQWAERLGPDGEAADVRLVQYVTLSDEISIRDIAERFERALDTVGLGAGREFDAIVHSTGMLVIRAWLIAYDRLTHGHPSRLKHLIGLAPATFGSPLAHKGRSLIGALVKGNKHWGPDFLEAGDRVLDQLELGSPFLWDLADQDLVGDQEVYGTTPDTPYPFIFVGTDTYQGWRTIVDEPGTDGTVRHSGVGFNTRKIALNLTHVEQDAWSKRTTVSPWRNMTVPLRFVAGANHATILREPPAPLVDEIREALTVDDEVAYEAWSTKPTADPPRKHLPHQFLVRVLDDRGDPVPDWLLQVGPLVHGVFEPLEASLVDVHAYRADTSYRCVQIDLHGREPGSDGLWLRLAASSGTEMVTYTGIRPQSGQWGWPGQEDDPAWTVILDLTASLTGHEIEFFRPFTTTLVDLRLDREPQVGVLSFVGSAQATGSSVSV